jgi:hypothetical protein
MNKTIPNADIAVQASLTNVYAYPVSQKAIDAGFKEMSMREEYSDQLRPYVHEFAKKHNLTVDYSKDW